MKKKWYASDTAFKVYSLLIAVLLWIFVIYDQNPESTKYVRNIPVYYSNIDALENEGYTVLLNEEDLSVDLKIKGKRLTLGGLSKKNINAYVTFHTLKSGEYDLNVTAQMPGNDLSVIDKNPSSVHVIVEKLAKKELDIGIEYSGINEEGKLASAEPKNQTVTVTGPESVINKVDSAKIMVDYGDVFANDEGVNSIHIYDEDKNDITDNKNIKISESEVRWNRKIYNVKDVSIDMVFEREDDYTVEELKISENAVKLCCSDDQTLDFDSVKTKAVTAQDAEKIKEGESIEVELELPKHVNVLRQDANGRWTVAENDTVRIEGKVVHVEKIPLKSDENLQLRSKDDSKEYYISEKPEYVFVKCSDENGTQQLWDTVFYVDVKDLTEGEHTVAITADLPDGAQFMENYEMKVIVNTKR